MKALGNMEHHHVNHEMMLLLLSVYESKGKEFYYNELFSRDKNVFERKVVEDNVYALGKFFDFDFTDSRLKGLSKKDLSAKNKQEHLFINIKNALTQTQKHPKNFELLVNEIDNLLRLLSRHAEPIKFRSYEKDAVKDLLSKKVKTNTRDDLEQLIRLFNRQLKTRTFELTTLIANFYVDFINMAIVDRNEQLVALILLYALLLKEFNVFNYISFFDMLLAKKAKWIDALNQANYYWATGYPQTNFLSKCIVDILKESYEKVDAFAHEFEFEKKVNKSDNIENTILKGPEIFSKEEIRAAHPTVSEATIDRTLKRLKDENIIRPLGKGRSSKWSRLVAGKSKNKHKDFDLFNYE